MSRLGVVRLYICVILLRERRRVCEAERGGLQCAPRARPCCTGMRHVAVPGFSLREC